MGWGEPRQVTVPWVGYTSTMAATTTAARRAQPQSTTDKIVDPAAQPASFLDVYAECRDVTEKLDLLAFAINELGDSKLTRTAKEYKDNKMEVGDPASFGSLLEMVNAGPAESMTEAKQLAAEAGLDLPEEPEGAPIEEQSGAAAKPESDEPKGSASN